MDEISDNDFKEFVKTVQDLALRAYPNPGRADCPGSQVIHEVALLSRPAAHPVFQSHIVRCSPCIQDVLAERTRIQSQRKNRRRAILADPGTFETVSYLTLTWQPPDDSADVAKYRVYWRRTDAPAWDNFEDVGLNTRYVATGRVIDNFFFGVASVSRDGHESTVVFQGGN